VFLISAVSRGAGKFDSTCQVVNAKIRNVPAHFPWAQTIDIILSLVWYRRLGSSCLCGFACPISQNCQPPEVDTKPTNRMTRNAIAMHSRTKKLHYATAILWSLTPSVHSRGPNDPRQLTHCYALDTNQYGLKALSLFYSFIKAARLPCFWQWRGIKKVICMSLNVQLDNLRLPISHQLLTGCLWLVGCGSY